MKPLHEAITAWRTLVDSHDSLDKEIASAWRDVLRSFWWATQGHNHHETIMGLTACPATVEFIEGYSEAATGIKSAKPATESVCPDCKNTGWRITNPEWPAGTKAHRERCHCEAGNSPTDET